MLKKKTLRIASFVSLAVLLLLSLAFVGWQQHEALRVGYEEQLAQVTRTYQDSLGYYRLLESANRALLDGDHEMALHTFIEADRMMGGIHWDAQMSEYLLKNEKKAGLFDSIIRQNRLLSAREVALNDSLYQLHSRSGRQEAALDSLSQQLFGVSLAANKRLELNQRLEREMEQLRKSYGKLVFPNSEGKTIIYFGEIEGEKANGYGIGIFDGKGIYDGFWKDNLRHGTGKYKWKNDDVYEGEFVEGKREGWGTYSFATGEKYVGGWKNDLREGKGAFYAKDGNMLFAGFWTQDSYIRGSHNLLE